MKQSGETRNKSIHLWSINFQQSAKAIQKGSDTGTMGQLYFTFYMCKNELKWFKGLNVKAITRNPQKKTQVKFGDLGL